MRDLNTIYALVKLAQALITLVKLRHTSPRPAVEIGYVRAVTEEGNPHARAVSREVFSTCEAEWRAIGMIPQSGLELGQEYRSFDATTRFPVEIPDPVIDVYRQWRPSPLFRARRLEKALDTPARTTTTSHRQRL